MAYSVAALMNDILNTNGAAWLGGFRYGCMRPPSSLVSCAIVEYRPESCVTENCIDLWSADLSANNQFQRRAYALLSADELDRAESFRFAIHKNRFVVRRGILRVLLGRYLSRDPKAISFVYGANGKPSLAEDPLHFNLSHSEDLSCFAFSTSLRLGIDIERVRPLPDLFTVAHAFCSSVEISAMKSLPAQDQPALFFQYWTRKEALVKALGGGLLDPVHGLNASTPESIESASNRSVNSEAAGWYFHSWKADEGYIGSLASSFLAGEIVQRRFTEFS